MEQNIFINKFW